MKFAKVQGRRTPCSSFLFRCPLSCKGNEQRKVEVIYACSKIDQKFVTKSFNYCFPAKSKKIFVKTSTYFIPVWGQKVLKSDF